MERFTEKLPDGRMVLKEYKHYSEVFSPKYGNFIEGEAVDRLAEYENLEEQEKLLRPPYFAKEIEHAIVTNCDGCKNDNTNECMHCMRAYTDCYET